MHKRIKHQKPKNFNASLKKLLVKLKPYTVGIVIASLFSIFSTGLAIAGPELLRKITNEIQLGIINHINMEALLETSMLLIGIALFCLLSVSYNFSKNMRTDVSRKINLIPLKLFDTRTVGDTMSIITNDVDTIYDGLHQSISNIPYAIVTLLGVTVMMFVTNWIMALVAMTTTIAGFLLTFLISSFSKKYFKKQQKNLGTLNGYIEEIYSCHNIVHTYNGIEEEKQQFKKLNDALATSSQKSSFLGGLVPPIMSFIGSVSYIAICIVGAMLTMNNTIDFGTIIAFIFYVRLFSNPLNTLAQAFPKIQSIVAAAERVFDFMDEAEMSSEENINFCLDVEKVKGNIEFQNVCFAYNETPVIDNFSINLTPGQKVAIVGHTGAGKTTLVNLLMRFYDIQSGDIKIDNVSINKLTRSNVRKLFCMVLQQTWLFKGTIKENIIYNQKNITEDNMIQACKLAGIHEFINNLPDKYETVLDENNNLSEGQKQLITIARAILNPAPFLILDEATSSVDRKTEELVQASMDTLMKNKTSFIIAHRLSTIQNADLILVLENGNLVECGTHDELLTKNNIYADLYYSQFTT